MGLEEQIAAAVQTAIELATAPLRARIAVLETRAAQLPRDGRDGLPGPAGEKGEKGDKGLDGTDGKDGTLEALTVVPSDDFRTLSFCAKDGTPLGVVTFPIVLDRGVYDATKAYTAGDLVTQSDGLWIAQAAVSGITPGAGATPWRLAVRKGQKGRDGKDGTPGRDGKEGTPGRPAVHPMTGRSW